MKKEDIAVLAQALIAEVKASQESFGVNPEIHAQQHAFITAMIQKEENRRLFWIGMKEKIVGSVVLSALLFIVSALGYAALKWLEEKVGVKL